MNGWMSTMNNKDETIQGTDAWLKMRRNFIGGSDCPVILKLDPWRTPYELFEEKLGLIKNVENAAMRRGKELEPLAREEFEKVTGIKVQPQVIFHPQVKYMMASMDGISDDGKTAVELKCPGELTYRLAVEGKVTEHYQAQLQHQMAVTGLKKIFYFCFDGSAGILLEIERNDSYIETIYREEEEFWNRLQNFDPPPLLDKDYRKKNSPEWLEMVRNYETSRKMREKYEKEEEAFRQCLIDLSGGQSSEGGGIRLTRYIRKGAIDYGSVPELQGLDLEEYRKKPSEGWRITCKNI
jgi:putative phage-type endonuclease